MIQNIKNRLEKKFENWAYFIYDHHAKIIPMVFITVILLAINIINIKIDVSTEGFLYEDDPNRVAYTEFRNQFGRDEQIIIAIKNEAIFTPQFLNELHAMHKELETTVPYLKDIQSLINARKTRGKNNALLVDDLFQTFPIDEASIKEAESYIQESNFFDNLLISEDKTFTTLVITSQTYSSIGNVAPVEDEFADDFSEELGGEASQELEFITDSENSQMLAVVNRIVNKYREKGLDIHI